MLASVPILHNIASQVREVGIAGIVDIAIVTLVIYTFMVVVKRTRRSGLIFAGILIIAMLGIAIDALLRLLQRRLDPTMQR